MCVHVSQRNDDSREGNRGSFMCSEALCSGGCLCLGKEGERTHKHSTEREVQRDQVEREEERERERERERGGGEGWQIYGGQRVCVPAVCVRQAERVVSFLRLSR